MPVSPRYGCVMIHFFSSFAIYPCRTCASMLLPESPIRQSVQPLAEGSLNDTIMVQQQHCTLGAKAFPFVFSISSLVFGMLVSIVVFVMFHPVIFNSLVYFRLLIVFTAISTSPSLASLSGKSLRLWMAFSA